MNETTTLSELEGNNLNSGPNKSALDDWYISIRDTPIVNLSDGGIARCVRQRLFFPIIIREALKRLQQRPLAGDYYEGELLAALSLIKRDEWIHLGEMRQEAASALLGVHCIQIENIDNSQVLSDLSLLRKATED